MCSPLTRCLLFSWVVVYLCLSKGIKSSGKVVYFTATFPYVLLLVLLVRGCTLDGALDGILYFITPTWSKLFAVSTWRAAAGQLFFSLGTSWGCLIMFGSYNRFRNNCYFDAVLVSSLDTLTSLIAGFVIFSVLGHLALELGTTVDKVASDGVGLAFVVYPEALSTLPFAHFWAICFFFMLFILGLDSEFAFLETVLTVLYDRYPRLRRRRASVTLGMCIACFLVALPCTTRGGLDIVDLFNSYSDYTVLIIAVFELATIFWLYGLERFVGDIRFMLDRTPSLYWRSMWLVGAPAVIVGVLVLALMNFQSFTVKRGWPLWADLLGGLFGVTGFVPPLFVGVFVWLTAKGETALDRWRIVSNPTQDWGAGDPEARKLQRAAQRTASTPGTANASYAAYDNPNYSANR